MLSVLAGLTPRGITELFNILDRDSGKYTFSVSCYMLELYQDDLADLLLPASQKQQGPQKVLNQSDSLLVLLFCILVSGAEFLSSQFTLVDWTTTVCSSLFDLHESEVPDTVYKCQGFEIR